MRFITLLTDYHFKDYYLAKVKTRAMKSFLGDTILDICHEIAPHNIERAGFAFNAMVEEFSPSDIHFIFINLHYQRNYQILVAQTKEHGTIIAPNNGLLGLIKVEFTAFYELPLINSSFIELDIIEKVSKLDISTLKKVENPVLLKNKELRYREGEMTGEIIYCDVYGNNIVNIQKEEFEAFTENSMYEIVVRRENVSTISTDYSDNWDAGVVVFFNHQGFMEISNTSGNTSDLMGLRIGMKINVRKI